MPSPNTDAAPNPATTALAPNIHPEKISRVPEIFFAVTVLVLVALQIFKAHVEFAHQPGSDWNSSDWMINYSAGFVRRGFGGYLFAHIMSITGLGFFPIWIAISLLTYIPLCLWLLLVSVRLRGRAVWRFALLMNPVLLLFICEYSSFLRKDVLFLLATLLNVTVGASILRRRNSAAHTSATNVLPLLFAIGLPAIVLALLHEGLFLFAWLPLNVAVCAFVLAKLHFRHKSIALLLAITLAPALIATAACALHHGNEPIAQTICTSWHPAVPTYCDIENHSPPSIAAISWGFHQAWGIFLFLAWRFPVYLLLFAILGLVEILTVLALVPSARFEHLLPALAMPFAASLPLFVLGEDWGRWLSMVAISSLILMLSEDLNSAVYCLLPRALQNIFSRRIAPSSARFLAATRRWIERDWFIFSLILFRITVPLTPFLGAILFTHPLGDVLTFLRQHLH